MIETQPASLEAEYRQFYTNTFKAQEKTELMSEMLLEPDEVLDCHRDLKAIGHIRFSIWLDLKGRSDRGPHGY